MGVDGLPHVLEHGLEAGEVGELEIIDDDDEVGVLGVELGGDALHDLEDVLRGSGRRALDPVRSEAVEGFIGALGNREKVVSEQPFQCGRQTFDLGHAGGEDADALHGLPRVGAANSSRS